MGLLKVDKYFHKSSEISLRNNYKLQITHLQHTVIVSFKANEICFDFCLFCDVLLMF